MAFLVSVPQLTHAVICLDVLPVCVRPDRISEMMVLIYQSSLKRRTVQQFQRLH